MNVLKVSLSKPRQTTDGVSVWEWSGSALDEGDEASQWFSNYLGKPSRLVRFNTGSVSSFCILKDLECRTLHPLIRDTNKSKNYFG